jgi:nucleoside-diphosphate-sugar epimerase
MNLLITGICGFAGGMGNTFSWLQLSRWCREQFGEHKICADDTPCPFDIPWMTMDSSRARLFWNWQPQMKLAEIFEEIVKYAVAHKSGLDFPVDF